jgi:Iron-regulated ABC transporter ATPase subunit SufC
MELLKINNLKVGIEDKLIIKGLNLTINLGEVHAIMGPNGTGKSTLANVLAGKPGYNVLEGEIIFMGKNLLEMEPEEGIL